MCLCAGQFVDPERVHRGMLGGFGRRLVREVKASRRRQLAQKLHNKVCWYITFVCTSHHKGMIKMFTAGQTECLMY